MEELTITRNIGRGGCIMVYSGAGGGLIAKLEFLYNAALKKRNNRFSSQTISSPVTVTVPPRCLACYYNFPVRLERQARNRERSWQLFLDLFGLTDYKFFWFSSRIAELSCPTRKVEIFCFEFALLGFYLYWRVCSNVISTAQEGKGTESPLSAA
jgi:hypothetical protein